jgi:glycosyltransferase involved in cell wall biosynthesis
MAKVSIVITCYNYGQFLIDAVESALGQTFTDFEIIVIDDGSTDNTPNVITKYSSDSRVHYVRQQNLGQPKAKNRGIAESGGEFVAFLDADDIWMPDKLERQMQLFSNPAVGVVYSRRHWIDPEGCIIDGNERTLRRGNVLDYIFVDNFVCFSSSVVRKRLLLEVGGFDESLPMGIDYDLWIRLAARCRFDFVNGPLVKYRSGHANLSKNIRLRYDCAKSIMNKALADPEICKKLSWWVPRLAWADTWANMGYSVRSKGDFRKSVTYYLRSIKTMPIFVSAWKGLFCCLIRRQ